KGVPSGAIIRSDTPPARVVGYSSTGRVTSPNARVPDHTGRPRGTRSSRPFLSFVPSLAFLPLASLLAPLEPEPFAALVFEALASLSLAFLDFDLGTGRRLVPARRQAALERRLQIAGARALLGLLPAHLLAVALALDELEDALAVLVL